MLRNRSYIGSPRTKRRSHFFGYLAAWIRLGLGRRKEKRGEPTGTG